MYNKNSDQEAIQNFILLIKVVVLKILNFVIFQDQCFATMAWDWEMLLGVAFSKKHWNKTMNDT